MSTSILALMRVAQKMKEEARGLHYDTKCPPGCVCVAEADFSEDDRAFLRSLATVDASGQFVLNTREMSDAQLADLKAFALRLKDKEQAA